MAWKIILYYHIYIRSLYLTCLYSYSYSLLLWDFNSMWIIWSEINGALKRLSEMWICEWWRHIHTQIRTNQGIAALAWLQQCIRNKVSLISEAHVQYTTFFGFLYCQDQKTVNHNPHIQNRTHESHSRAFQSLKAIVVSLCV